MDLVESMEYGPPNPKEQGTWGAIIKSGPYS